MSTVVTSLAVEISANVGTALSNIKKVQEELNKVVSADNSITLFADVQFKQGAAQKIARATKAIMSTLSQSAVVDVDLRLKQGAAQALRSTIKSAAANGVVIPVSGSGGGSGGSGSGSSSGGSAGFGDAGIARDSELVARKISSETDKAITSVTKLASQWTPVVSEVQAYLQTVRETTAAQKLDEKAIGTLSSAWSPAISQAKQYEMAVREAAASAKAAAAQVRAIPKSFNLGGQVLSQQQAQGMGAAWAKDIEDGMAKAGRSVDRFGKESKVSLESTNSWFDKTRRTVLAFATGYVIVQGITKAIHELREAVIGYNQSIDDARISFGALMSQGAVEKLIGQLQQLAETTPFEFKDLLPFAQRLVQVGRDVKTLTKDMRSIGDFVSLRNIGNDGFERIIYNLQQMKELGRVTGREIKDLSNSLVPAVSILAKSWGVTTEKMQEFISKGIIPADKAVDALIKGMGKMGANAMDKKAKTLEGAMSNLRDSFQRVMGEAARPEFDKLKDSLNNLVETIQKPEFRVWATQTMHTVFSALSTFGNLVKWVAVQVEDKFPYIIGILAVLGGAKIISGINALNTAVREMAVTAAFTGKSATAALGIWAAAIIAFIAVYRNFKVVRDITEFVGVGVLTIFKGIGHGIGWLAGQLSQLPRLFAKVLGWIPDWFLKFMDAANLGANPIWQILQQAKSMAPAIADAVDMSNVEVDSDKFWDEQIASFKRGKDKFDKTMTGGLSGLMGLDNLKAQAAALVKETAYDSIPNYAGQFRPGKDDDKKARDKAERERMKRLKDMLGDNADAWKKYAQVVEAATKSSLKSMQEMQKGLTDVFDSIKNDLVGKGITNDPLGGAIKILGDAFKLGTMQRALAEKATKEINNALEQARRYESKKEIANKLDGVVGGSGPLPPASVAGLRAAPKTFNGKSVNEKNPFAEDIKEAKDSLSTITAVQKGWGDAVRDIEGSAIRFRFQTMLTTRSGADLLKQVDAVLGSKSEGPKLLSRLSKELGANFNLGNLQGMERAAAFMRQLANAMDIRRNQAILPDLLRELNKQTKELVDGKEIETSATQSAIKWMEAYGYNSVRIGRQSELTAEGKRIEAEVMKNELIPAQMKSAAIQERIKATWDAKDVQLFADAFFENAKAIDDASRELQGLNDETVQQIAHRKIFNAENAYLISDLDKQKRFAAEVNLELGKLDREHTLAMRSMRDEMHLVNTERELLNKNLSDREVTEQLQQQTDFVGKFNALTRAGVDGLKAFGMAMAEATGQKWLRRNKETNAVLREQAQTMRDLNAEMAQQARVQGAILDTPSGGAAREQTLAVLNKQEELRKKYEGKGASGQISMSEEFVTWMQLMRGNWLTEALTAYKQQTDDAADATKLFGDLSGMAAIRLRLQKEATKDLTAEQRAQLEVTAAGVLGVQRYTSMYDGLFQQQFSLMEELEKRRMQMSRNVTDLQQQELRWKYEDLEITARQVDMSQQERTAYEQQRPAVLRLRDAVRALYAEIEGLRYEEWGKTFNERFAEMTSGLGNLASMRTQLRRDGFKEDDIKIILNKERWLDMAQQISSGVGDAFSNLFAGIMNHSENLLDSLLDTVKQTMQKIAQEILMSQVYQWIGGAIGQVFGGVAASGSKVGKGTGGAAVDSLPDASTSYYSSITSRSLVPRDMTMVNSLAAGGSGSGSVVVQQYHVEKVVANDPTEFRRKLPGQEQSRAYMNRQLARTMQGAAGAA